MVLAKQPKNTTI